MQTKAWEMKSRDRKKSSKARKMQVNLKQFLKCEICCLVGGRGEGGKSKL